tara:strand:- start:117 stop:239 length:123 start_codon:yes stop_codon:yes gene_type:complete
MYFVLKRAVVICVRKMRRGIWNMELGKKVETAQAAFIPVE